MKMTEIERLRAQLPEGMKHCTIVFQECSLGHGWLTATNWAPFDCPTCAIATERARTEKAEAERDSLRNRLKPSLEYVEGTACGYGDDEIDRMAAQRDSERARAERYLAAMREWVEADASHSVEAFARSYRTGTRSRVESAENAIRALVEEEASRG